jgi:uncharacterized peroxidase-related enzyme
LLPWIQAASGPADKEGEAIGMVSGSRGRTARPASKNNTDHMPRYTLTEYDAAVPATRDVYDDFMRATGATELPVWIKSLGHSPSLARAYWERAKGTLLGGNLPLPLKEMIVFVVSSQNGAKYCSACHAQAVLHLDKSLVFDDLQASVKSGSALHLPAYYQSVVAFARKVVQDANALDDADFDALMDEGFSREEICEIIAVIDMATMFNVYTSALRLDLDPQYRAIL